MNQKAFIDEVSQVTFLANWKADASGDMSVFTKVGRSMTYTGAESTALTTHW